jgi:hypothetical protein
MRPKPATRAASHVDSCSALVTARHAMTALARQRSPGVPHLLKPVAAPCSCDHRPATAAAGQQPCPAPRSGRRGGRNARATRSRSRACWECPRRFTLENRRLPLALPQSFGSSATPRFAEPTLRHFVVPRNTKKVRGLCRTCGRCVLPVEERGKLEANRGRGPGRLEPAFHIAQGRKVRANGPRADECVRPTRTQRQDFEVFDCGLLWGVRRREKAQPKPRPHSAI